MRLDEALAGVQRLALDTAPLIYYIEAHPRYLTVMRQVLTAIESGQLRAVSSVITLTEVLTRPLRDGHEDLAARYREIFVESGISS